MLKETYGIETVCVTQKDADVGGNKEPIMICQKDCHAAPADTGSAQFKGDAADDSGNTEVIKR